MEKRANKQNLTCGVPKCYSSRKDGISLYHIPKDVRASQSLMKQWSQAIGRSKPFPKSFLICSKHFDRMDILKGVTSYAKLSRLTQQAVPKKNLPNSSGKSSNKVKVGRISKRYLTTERRSIQNMEDNEEQVLDNPKEETNHQNNTSLSDPFEEDSMCWLTENSEEEVFDEVQEITTHQIIEDLSDEEEVSYDVQENTNNQTNEEDTVHELMECSGEEVSNDVQEIKTQQKNEDLSNHLKENTTLKPIESFVGHVNKFETPEKIDKCIQVNFSSGLFVGNTALWDTDRKLYTMTGLPDFNTLNILTKACQKIRPIDKMLMSIRDRILLTMYKLKTNCYFAELAITFELSDKSAKLYFVDTIKLLAKATKGLIYWQTQDEHNKSRPNSFKPFPNVRTVLNCMEINTVYFQTLECKSHYKGSYTLQVLIGVAPSGYINYLSKVEFEESSGETKFNLSNLFALLGQGDAVIVDKELLSENEFLKAGIELIDARKNTQTMAAKVYIERKICGIRAFKVLSEKIHKSMEPYIDDVITVICGLANLKRSQNS